MSEHAPEEMKRSVPPPAGEGSEPSPEPSDPNAYRVQLPNFEGPLDLLLHLIQKHELDVLSIPIGFISEKFVEYIRLMEELSIDIAAEYLVMAATLAHIKSRSLLPPDPSQVEEDELSEEEEDPRAELIRRLLEYQKYKDAAANLGERTVLGRDVFPRGAPVEQTSGPAPLASLSLFKLMDAFEAVLKRAKQVEDHQIDFERISISERIGQIAELLEVKGELRFEELFEENVTRAEMIVTFLALLEMTKLRMTRLRQDGPLQPIYISLTVAGESEPEVASEGAAATEPEAPSEGEGSALADVEPEASSFEELGAASFEELGAASTEELGAASTEELGAESTEELGAESLEELGADFELALVDERPLGTPQELPQNVGAGVSPALGDADGSVDGAQSLEGSKPQSSDSEVAAPHEAPFDEGLLDEASLDEASLDEASLDEAPLDEAPLDEAPLDEAPLDAPISGAERASSAVLPDAAGGSEVVALAESEGPNPTPPEGKRLRGE